MNQAIRGVLPVVHMPYRTDESIDHAALQREVDYLFGLGAQGCCLALASDTLRLTAAERLALPEQLVRYAAGRGPVIISVGAESTAQSRLYAEAAAAGGASAIMAIPPLSQSVDDGELRRYFEGMLQAVDLPVLIQDASSYVGRSMSTAFMAAMQRDFGERILFKPEANPLGPCITALLRQTAGQAAILEGSGGILLMDAHRRGIRGTMPGVDLLDGIVALWQALEAGTEDAAYAVYFPICAIVALQLQGGLDGFITIERYLMHRRGIFPNQVHRGPLHYRPDEATTAEVDRLYERLQQALAALPEK